MDPRVQAWESCRKEKKRKMENVEAVWQCVRGCSTCCKLDNNLAFPTIEDSFIDDPFTSRSTLLPLLVGPGGMVNRPFFCWLEPTIFQEFESPRLRSSFFLKIGWKWIGPEFLSKWIINRLGRITYLINMMSLGSKI